MAEYLKDKKIQFYRVIKEKEGTVNKYYRSFIYSKTVYDDNGLWVYVRNLMDSEKISRGRNIDTKSLKVIVNYNTKITTELKALFNNETYDVSGVDNYEFYMDDIQLVITKNNDKTNYTGDRYE